MTWRDLRFYSYVAAPFIAIPLIVVVVLYEHCKTLPAANTQIGVTAQDFKEPVKEAMKIWNKAVGCIIFEPGDDVLFGSTDGEPCGLAFHPAIEDGHAASSYQCGARWEIHVERPGDLRTQTCIAIHELGHVLGLEDSNEPNDSMHVKWCPPDGKILWPSDSEQRTVRKLFCP